MSSAVVSHKFADLIRVMLYIILFAIIGFTNIKIASELVKEGVLTSGDSEAIKLAYSLFSPIFVLLVWTAVDDILTGVQRISSTTERATRVLLGICIAVFLFISVGDTTFTGNLAVIHEKALWAFVAIPLIHGVGLCAKEGFERVGEVMSHG